MFSTHCGHHIISSHFEWKMAVSSCVSAISSHSCLNKSIIFLDGTVHEPLLVHAQWNSFLFMLRRSKWNLKDIIRFYNIKDFIKLLKSRFPIGTLDKLYVAPLNCHWNCLKYKGRWFRILGDFRESKKSIWRHKKTAGLFCRKNDIT